MTITQRIAYSCRYAAAWVFTAITSIVCFSAAVLCGPRRAWVWFRQPWGRITCAIVGTRLHVEGLAHLQCGPAVFIANHTSLIDGALIPALLPKTTCLIAKKELQMIPFLGWMLAYGGAIMVDRKNAARAIESIREGLRTLPPGWSVFVFPEGTRSDDGALKVFKKGAFHVAMQAGLPIVPIGIAGAREVVPKHGWLLRPADVFVTIGKPIATDSWRLKTLDAHVEESRRAVRDCLHRAAERHNSTRSVGNSVSMRCVVH